MGDRLESDDRFLPRLPEGLAGAEDERHPGPAPAVDRDFDFGQCFRFAGWIDPRLVRVVGNLPFADDAGGVPGTACRPGKRLLNFAGAEYGTDPVAQIPFIERCRGIQGDQCHDFEQVALNHVPQGAGGVVVTCAVFEREFLIEDNLHLFDVGVVPQRLKQPVGEPETEDVEDGDLAEEVVHPVDMVLRNQADQGRIKFRGRFLTGTERLLHHQPRTDRDILGLEHFGGLLADGRRQREVDGDRTLQLVQQGRQRTGRRHIDAVVIRIGGERFECCLAVVVRFFRTAGKRGADAVLPFFPGPVLDAGADQLDLPGLAAADQPPQSRQQQPAGEIAGRAEDQQRLHFRLRLLHRAFRYSHKVQHATDQEDCAGSAAPLVDEAAGTGAVLPSSQACRGLIP